MKKIAIIGGGVTGIALAFQLAKKKYSVTLFEQQKTIGGLAKSFQTDKYACEKYYHHLFLDHQEIITVVNELNLQKDLVFEQAKMGIYSDGKIFPFNSKLDLLRFRPLSFFHRIWFGLTSLRIMGHKNWKKLDGLTAVDFLKRSFGSTIYHKIWKPLLKNKFADNYQEVSAGWLWDRLVSRVKSRKRKNELLGYFSGGFENLLNAMVNDIKQKNSNIRTACHVSQISIQNNTLSGLVCQGSQIDFDMVIVSLNIPEFLKLTPDLPNIYRQSLANIDYCHIICLVLRLKKALSSYYWINISDPDIPFAVIVEHTNWINSQLYGGEHIIYLSQYVSSERDDTFNMSDSALLEKYSRSLKKIFDDFSEDLILDYKIFRNRHAQTVFKKNFHTIKPTFTTPAKNLYLVNTSQFFPESRCMNNSFKIAREFIEKTGL